MATSKNDYVTKILRLLELGFPGDSISGAQKEYRFHPIRRWKFDIAFPSRKVAVEIDGGGFGRPVVCQRCLQTVKRKTAKGKTVIVREGGRHNTGTGANADNEKFNAAAMLGWRVLRFTTSALARNMGAAINTIRAALDTQIDIEKGEWQ